MTRPLVKVVERSLVNAKIRPLTVGGFQANHSTSSSDRYSESDQGFKARHKSPNLWLLSAGLLGGTCVYLFYRLKQQMTRNPLLLRSDPSASLKLSDNAIDNLDGTLKAAENKFGFRDRKVVQYENRVKQYSTPDKIFRYWATLKIGNEVYMTPADFVRSIIPDTKQPDGLGLDKFKTFSPENYQKDTLSEEELPKNSFFYRLGNHGLISFSDYVFLLTVLSTPSKNFEVGFKVFDINGDGVVEFNEFDQVASVIRASGSVGQRHRNHKTTGNVINQSVSSALASYFFGPDLDKKLSIKDFLKFQAELHRGVLELECRRFSKGRDSLNAIQLSKLLLMYLPQSAGKKSKMLNRVKRLYKEKKKETAGLLSGSGSDTMEKLNTELTNYRIPMEDVYAFWELLTRINEVEHAISFWTVSGAPIDKDTFNLVAQIVGKKRLNPQLVDVVFTLFDDDGDGMLSHKEFFEVMEQRYSRNLSKSRDMGLHRLAQSCYNCLKVTSCGCNFYKLLGLKSSSSKHK